MDILNFSSGYLAKYDISEPRLNAELLMAHVLNCKRLDLYLLFDKPLSGEEKSKYKSLLKRRINKEPVQYITGSTNFYGYDVLVKPGVLIPRQETEVLVEESLKYLNEIEEIKVLEIGTGSGCISISIAKELSKAGKVFTIDAIDIDEEALNIAFDNIMINNCNKLINLKKKDFFDFKDLSDYNFIISNPPYIALNEYDILDEEVRCYEPKIALTDGKDGLSFYKMIFSLLNSSQNKFFLCEFAYNQKKSLLALLKEYNLTNYSFVKDYSRNDRVLAVKV